MASEVVDGVVAEPVFRLNDYIADQFSMFSDETAKVLGVVVAVVIALVIALVSDYAARKLIVGAVKRFIKKTKVTWDDELLKHRVFARVGHLVPAIVIRMMASMVLAGYDGAIEVVRECAGVYMVVMGVLAIDSLLNAVVAILRRFEIGRRLPLGGLVQVIKLVLYIFATLFGLSLIIGDDAYKMLAGMGAMTAVTMLVFKDAILGFVAGIQLAANKMVRIGDWIEMSKYGADGDVIDITLTTVKVQNWDKTISTIPAYSLISDSFRNWRGMSEAGGRRIKRSLYIDMNSIGFCTDEMLDKFAKFECLREYIAEKKKEIAEYNAEHDVANSDGINGRKLTNVGTFRAYVTQYLKNHPLVNKDMTLMVRQLEPTPKGLPMQVYIFCTDKRWVHYEGVQADIFDHIFSVIGEFGLRVYQEPAGSDFNSEFTVRSMVRD
ncbi:MAG: mechanosensitive ion channel [Anaerohalosphaera sp.]|nr:mechanosensitive ion channel [Anaerohalosphaera sp.]